MDPKKFKAPFIPKTDIWKTAEGVRRKYPRANKLPVEVLELAEFDLKLEIDVIPNLKDKCSVEAFLSRDLSILHIDSKAFMDEKRQCRLRFSVAHELGHFFLHSSVFQGLKFSKISEWVDFIHDVPDAEYSWIEYQAYEFAGRLLVPVDELKKELKLNVKKAEIQGYSNWDASGSTAIDFLSKGIAANFGVSAEVISKRIKSEELWPPK